MSDYMNNEIQDCLPWLNRHALRLARNRDSADDLVQASLERALRGQHQFQEGTNFRSWMYRILRNTYINQLRRDRRWQQTIDISEHDELHATKASQLAHMEFREVADALMDMCKRDRDMLIMVGGEGRTYEEAAETFGIALGTVRSRLSRARARLADRLAFDAAA